MATYASLEPSAPWTQLSTTQEDWDAAEPSLLRTMFSQMTVIRVFEEFVLELAGAGLIHGPAHSSIGQEGGAVGSDQYRRVPRAAAPWPGTGDAHDVSR